MERLAISGDRHRAEPFGLPTASGTQKSLSAPRTQDADRHRHVGIVVDDKEAVRAAALAAGIAVSGPPSLDVHDPWGNLLQVVDYREVQFTKAPEVLAALGQDGLEKTAAAAAELRGKGIVPRTP